MDPKLMASRMRESDCASCDVKIKRGDQIFWERRDGKSLAWHAGCPAPKTHQCPMCGQPVVTPIVVRPITAAVA